MNDMTEKHRTLLDMTALQTAADVVNDLEGVRMANAARYGALTGFTVDGRPWKADKDEQVRTTGLAADHPGVVSLKAIVEGIAKIEGEAVKTLEKAMKAHPLGPWVIAQRGLGLKQAGRLLASIGDPYWRPALEYLDDDDKVIDSKEEGPRTVSALWAYAGEHVIDGAAARRKKGVRSNWSTNAKTRAWLCAESCVKQLGADCKRGGAATLGEDTSTAAPPIHLTEGCKCSPFRVAYDLRKARTTANRPDWTDGHRHVDAMRISAKTILKHVWREARRLHLELDPDLVENLPVFDTP